jgi:hypothetical protein
MYCVALNVPVLRQTMAMNEAELLEEASYAWDDGRRSDALQLMRFAVQSDPSLLVVRRALAERYREMGNPDQAGRWGIVFDGWTTEIERDRLARLLAASGVSESQTATFLALHHDELPEVVTGILHGSVVKYRSKYERSALTRYADERSDQFSFTDLALLSWGLFAVANVVGSFVTFGFAVFGSVGSAEARVGALFLVGILTNAFVWSAALAIQLRSKTWALVWGVLAMGAAFTTLLYGVNGWIYR